MWKMILELVAAWWKNSKGQRAERGEQKEDREGQRAEGEGKPRLFDGKPIPEGAVIGNDEMDAVPHRHPPAVVEIPRTIVGCREVKVRWNPNTSRRLGKVIFPAAWCGKISGVAWFTPDGSDGEVMRLMHPHEIWSRERFYSVREMGVMPAGPILVRAETTDGPVYAQVLDCHQEQG